MTDQFDPDERERLITEKQRELRQALDVYKTATPGTCEHFAFDVGEDPISKEAVFSLIEENACEKLSQWGITDSDQLNRMMAQFREQAKSMTDGQNKSLCYRLRPSFTQTPVLLTPCKAADQNLVRLVQ
jgi:hypothetical protein